MNDGATVQCCGVNGQARTRSGRGHFHNYIRSESLMLEINQAPGETGLQLQCVCVCVCKI